MAKSTVLVVDDEHHIVHVLALKLKHAGYEVITASNGREALQVLNERRPDVVITDYSMPEMNGYEFVQALQADERTRNLPVVMLTARGQEVVENGPGEARIDVLLSKPFSPRELLEHVQGLVGTVC